MSKILHKIEQLATRVADQALNGDTSAGDRVETLKVLTPFYTLLKKAEAKVEEPDETTMAGLQAQLEEVEQNGSEIQRRRGRKRTHAQ
jgi:hypothetical protein